MVEVSDRSLLAFLTLFGPSAAVVAVVVIPGAGVVAAVVGPSLTTTIYRAFAGVLAGSTVGIATGALTIGRLRGKPPTAASEQQMARLYQQMADDLQICRAVILSAAVHCDVRDGRALARKRLRLVEALNALGQAGQVPEMAEAVRRITRARSTGRNWRGHSASCSREVRSARRCSTPPFAS